MFLSNRAVKRKRRSTFLQVNGILSVTDIPSVTLVAPAFNEQLTTVENVKFLLSIQYPFYELIIVALLFEGYNASSQFPLQDLCEIVKHRSTSAEFRKDGAVRKSQICESIKPIAENRISFQFIQTSRMYLPVRIIRSTNHGSTIEVMLIFGT